MFCFNSAATDGDIKRSHGDLMDLTLSGSSTPKKNTQNHYKINAVKNNRKKVSRGCALLALSESYGPDLSTEGGGDGAVVGVARNMPSDMHNKKNVKTKFSK